MREIKFRLWNGSLIEPVGDITFHTDGSYHVNDEYPVNDKTMETKFGGNRYYLMAYTGLKDKSGRDIYEGDIVQTSSDDPATDMWKPEDWGYAQVSMDLHGVHIVHGADHWPWNQEDTVFSLNYLQVIGNIYENPELLSQAS
jgi:uncharacterized phage protein (TIGR01671 family)